MTSGSDTTRWIFVDDTSPEIHYVQGQNWTSWTPVNDANVPVIDGGQLTEVGGQSFETAHYLEGEAGQFSFTFMGTFLLSQTISTLYSPCGDTYHLFVTA